MRIGIEAERANISNPTGVEHYAQQLILNLAKIDSQNEYILYLQTEPAKWLLALPGNFKTKIISFPVFWTQIRISLEMLLNPVDVLFIMASALPIIHPRNSVVTIHDIAWDFYPETFGTFMLNYLRFSTWFACKFAKKIIAVSNQTKTDLIKKYNLRPEKIEVVYHGFDLQSELQQSSPEELRKVSSLPEKFVLFVSTLQPRKNVIGLIEAFIELKKEKNIPHQLVLVGGKGWSYKQILDKIGKHPEIIYAGYAENRLAYIKKADLLVQPSFYEGFGMSILDAFAMKVPVACSNVSSLPEVAGEAAVYFDPKSKQEIKLAIYNVITDRSLHDRLVEKGSQRLSLFTWEKCSQQVLEVLTN
jgi:glycosyltransferase involved in cell wall biosynthesis